MKRLRLLLATACLAGALIPSLAVAGAPGLQLTPLQYEDNLGTTVKNGHIDVANPTDSPVTVEASVRGFHQQGTNGDLSFYDDADLARAITVDLKSFDLGPHDAVRVLFSVDPAKLPAGGTYAAIFFRTLPGDNNSGTSYVAQSANIGTLLILRNGAAVAPSGGVNALSVPFWQFGSGLRGSTTVHNAASPHGGVAFRPALSARVFPWGHRTAQPTGLVLPGSTRRFSVDHPGSYFGLLPLTVTDSATHTSRTAWVFACTGLAGWILLVIVVSLLALTLLRRFRPIRMRKESSQEITFMKKAFPQEVIPAPVQITPSVDATPIGVISDPDNTSPEPEPELAPESAQDPKPTLKVKVKSVHTVKVLPAGKRKSRPQS